MVSGLLLVKHSFNAVHRLILNPPAPKSFFSRLSIHCLMMLYLLTFPSVSIHQDHVLSSVANLNSQGTNIICFGDSLTYGKGASFGHDYPSLLGRALGMKVINAGVDGDTTGDALKRLDRDVLSKDLRMVIILLGANDYLDEVSVSKTFENLDKIIDRILDQGAMVVSVEIGASVFGEPLQQRWDQVAIRHRVIPVKGILNTYFFNPTLKSDSLHPNDKGYEMIAGHILKTVKPLLELSSSYLATFSQSQAED